MIVERYPMVGAAFGDFQPDSPDFRKLVAVTRLRVGNIDTRGVGLACCVGNSKVFLGMDDGVFKSTDRVFDIESKASKVDECVDHHLAWPVIGDLPTALGCDHRD